MFISPFSVTSMLALLWLSVPHQRIELSLFLTQHKYSEPQHTPLAKQGAEYVFFEGEDIALTVVLANRSAVPVRLSQRERVSEGVISAVVRQRDVLGSESRAVALKVGEPYLKSSRGRQHTGLDGALIDPQTSVRVPLALSERFSPGQYEVRVTAVLVGCSLPCTKVVDHGGLFRFEVRSAQGLPERLDVLFRKGMAAVDADPSLASTYVDRMLNEYPQCSAAYQLRGMQAEALGRAREAAEAYEAAAELVGSGADRLRRIEPGDDGGLYQHLRALANAARRN